MAEESVTTADVLPLTGHKQDDVSADGVAALRERIHRLEDAVAALQDTRPLEDRVVERVVERVRPPIARDNPEIKNGSRPPVLGVVRGNEESAPPAAIPMGLRETPSARQKSPWLLFDLLGEVRTIVRMYFDPRYHMSRLARLMPVVVLVIVALSWFFLDGHILYIGTVIDKLIDLFLFVLTYKVLTREADRYRAALAPSGSTKN
jgi:hypothetical protein